MSAIQTLRQALYGNPPSEGFMPDRDGVLTAFTTLANSVGFSGAGAITVIKTTRSLLDADLAHDADVVALVTSDSTPANNDIYIKVGASGTGSWTLTTLLHDLIDALAGPYSEQFDKILADVIKRSEQLEALKYTQQQIGYEGTIPNGTNDLAGTWALGVAFTDDGDGVKVGIYAATAGTLYVQIVDRSGTTNTVVVEEPITVEVGYNVYEVPVLPHSQGQYFGFRAAAGIARYSIASVDYVYWGSGGTQVSEGNSYTASEGEGLAFHIRCESIRDYAKGENIAAIDAVTRQVSDDQQFVIGRPADETPSDGVAAGGSWYVFERYAPFDMVLKRLRIFGETSGEIEISAWAGSNSNINQERVARPTVLAGSVLDDTDTRLIVYKGERFGIKALTGNYALTSPTSAPTPFRSINSTSGALGTLNTDIRFEMIAEFERYTLTERLENQENNRYENDTTGIHVVWIIGESHAAGRAVDFDSNIEIGRGYRYRRADTSIAHLVDPTGNDSTATDSPVRGSFGPSIGKAVLDASNGAIGVLVVNSAEGGTRAGVEWSSSGSAWAQAKNDWDAVIAEIITSKLPISGLTIASCLGSNDAFFGTAKSTFKSAYIDLISRARAYVNAGSDVPFAVVAVPPFRDGSNSAAVADVHAATAEIVRETANVYMASTLLQYASERGLFYDSIHVTQTANDGVGPGVAAVMLAHGTGIYPEL